MKKRSLRGLSFLLIFTLILTNFFSFRELQTVTAEGIYASEIFFSEYIEGSGSNKAIEIYNGTKNNVDLSQYTIELYSNGATEASKSATLAGTLKSGDVYVIANSSADPAINDLADAEENGVINFNGDDVLILKNDETIIDVFGKLGERTLWGDVTKDKTLVRKSSITGGDDDPDDEFDPSIEWEVYDKNTFDYLGSHTMDGFQCGGGSEKVATVTANPSAGEVEEGTEIILTTATEGSTIFYSIDSEQDGYEEYSNPIIVNDSITIWAKATKDGMEDSDVSSFEYTIKEEVAVISIAEARIKAIGEEVTVEGIVTADLGDNIYIQDDTAGIIVRLEGLNLDLGDKVQVSGNLNQYYDMAQIEPNSIEDITVVEAGAGVPEPQLIFSTDLNKENGEALEGELVRIENITVTEVDEHKNFTVEDSEGTTIIRPDDESWLEVGKDYLSVTGVVTYNFGEYKIYPRELDDIVLDSSANKVDIVTATPQPGEVEVGTEVVLETSTEGAYIYYTLDETSPSKESTLYIEAIIINENTTIKAIAVKEEMEDSDIVELLYTIKPTLDPDTQAPVITHIPITESNISKDLDIKAIVTDDRNIEAVKVFYRVKGVDTYKELDMTFTGSEYVAVIPKEDLDVAGLQYYLEASDGTNTATKPSDIKIPFKIEITDNDIEGPAITKLQPEDGQVFEESSEIQDISVEFNDPSGINEASLKLILDGDDVTLSAIHNDDAISYSIDEELENGSHSVTIEVSDILGNKTTRTWSFFIGKEEYNFYRGQIHSHTNYSDGKGSGKEAFEWARDKGKADFFAITDHSNWFDNEDDKSNENITDVSESTSSTWKNMHADADEYNEDGKFVAIAGYEMTWSGSTGGWGHINTLNTPWFASRSNSEMDLEAYYEHIAEDTDSISQLNHPGKTFGDFADFGFYSEEADSVVHLIEVGNGEGPIRGSGYFPSYEYYTRALDKGWHVAPSNNQDNHKGNWITSNEARTVILGQELTREAIYQGIREMRVYASEDSNLEVMYKINGEIMGSSLDEPEKLHVSIRVNDPDESDDIKSIKLISDGGVESAKKIFDSNQAVWEFELDPQYTYYYVRIDQADKDIAVTAPIWTAKMVPVGLSKVISSQDIVETNTPVDIEAEVYNNTDEILSEAIVTFYRDEIRSENKIGEVTVNNIGQGATDKAVIAWTPNQAGSYKIYATTSLSIDGVDKVSTVSTNIEVMDKEDIIKVVIDAGHMNHYVSGSYEGKITGFKEMLKSKKMMAVEDYDGLTSVDLADADILVITSPQPTDYSKYNLLKSKLSDEEIQVVKAFVDGGGSLIITSRADYKDGEGDYQNSIQANKVLESIESNLRINDDEVIDTENNEGQEYRLLFNNYTSSKFNLTSGSEVEDYGYSFYSGCSVVLATDGNDENVDFLVKGHSTTETKDADNASDKIPVEKGDVYVLAAEKLQGGGKVIVSGTTFFSDFEVSGDNINSNIQITKNILDWLKPEVNIELNTIAEVRKDADENGIPDNLGKKFMIEGRVTSESEAYTKAQGRKNAFFEVIYVQDETGGITVFGVSEKEIPLGTKVRVIGTVEQYQGDAELEIENESTDVVVLDDDIQIVEPKITTTGKSMLEENEGWLVKIQGTVTKIVTEGDNALYLDDGTGEARVLLQGYIDDGTGNPEKLGKWDLEIKVGDAVSAVGLASEDPIGHRLRVRNAAEIVKKDDTNNYPVQIAEVKTTDIEGNEISEFAYNNSVVVKASIKNLTQEDLNAMIFIKVIDANDVSYGLGFIPVAKLKAAEDNSYALGFRIHGIEKGTHVAKVYVWNNWNDRNVLSEVGKVEFTVK